MGKRRSLGFELLKIVLQGLGKAQHLLTLEPHSPTWFPKNRKLPRASMLYEAPVPGSGN